MCEGLTIGLKRDSEPLGVIGLVAVAQGVVAVARALPVGRAVQIPLARTLGNSIIW